MKKYFFITSSYSPQQALSGKLYHKTNRSRDRILVQKQDFAQNPVSWWVIIVWLINDTFFDSLFNYKLNGDISLTLEGRQRILASTYAFLERSLQITESVISPSNQLGWFCHYAHSIEDSLMPIIRWYSS